MSIGGTQALNKTHLKRFKALVDRYEPALISEHLAWSTHGSTYFNDLLPLPYTAATLARVADHIDQVQEALGRAGAHAVFGVDFKEAILLPVGKDRLQMFMLEARAYTARNRMCRKAECCRRLPS
jgi:hypothetical protein